MSTSGIPDWPWANAAADTLPRSERLLLDAMRAWHAAASSGPSPRVAATIVFAAERANDAAQPLDVLLRAAAVEPACVLCPRIAAAEATLLFACTLAQRGSRREALAVLLQILPLHAAAEALAAAIRTGLALRRAGLLLRHPFSRAPRSPPTMRA